MQGEPAKLAAPAHPPLVPGRLSLLLRGEVAALEAWSARWDARRITLHLTIVIVGAGLYGASMGWWRAPQQALYTAIKFPLIILLTAIGNAMLNAMLAPLLGLNIPFRQSFLSILMSCTISGAILGSFAPIMAFLIWNSPPLSPDRWTSEGPYTFILFTFVVVIAFAGVTANFRLLQLLRHLAGNRRTVAFRVLFAWLVGNLFFGGQLSWILRPFIGSPGLPVQFLRHDALKGNFYETIFHVVVKLFTFH